MATGEGAATTRTLQQTPTWAVATVCLVFIALSILIEHLIHLISKWLKGHKKTALFEAVEKLKSVLMVLGFMSLILTVTQSALSKICIPNKLANTMLPCHKSQPTKTTEAIGYDQIWSHQLHERTLAADTSESSSYCGSKGMTSLISTDGANQLSIFLFVLAAMQIVYSVVTMALGRAKMRRWKAWEKESQTVEYQAANDPNRFRFARQTTFARRHMNSCAETSILLWIKCFFQQFFNSVAKVDYLTLRHGFISAHLSTNTTFNFQKYIQRSLEDDFKVVVGISPLMWFFVVIFLLMDVHGWNVFLWVSFLPLTIVLVLGTKLQVVVAKMAHQVKDQNSVIQGAPLVQPNDNFFWLSQPKLVLTLLHYTLFMNAFEAAFFVWVTSQYGIKSCYHEYPGIIVTRMVLAVTVQVLCSYITLPLYALVTQMGSNFKSALFEEHTANAIRQWHAVVKQKRKKQGGASRVGNDYSNSNRNISSDLSTNHPTPNPSEIASFPSRTEIVEEDTEIQEEAAGPDVNKVPTAVDIEMPSTGKSLANK
ncbi:MLO-like protein 3 isoform X1 [Herrania umbratica]|uniref:MLO-like protein n=2 Tax=Herrania umbratica TaxID=108875 RepID=A0A6J0ZVA4_9ROSI|nr:MLO-like protein 3 isoform X1 [Herrania umbratica]